MLIKDKGKVYTLRAPKTLGFMYVEGKGLALYARKAFKKGDVISSYKGSIVPGFRASPEAVQVAEDMFLDGVYYVPEDFINHSCAPNARLDIEKGRFIALKKIAPRKEITYNYLTTEYDMVRFGHDFVCRCGAKQCYGRIKGFRFLTAAQKKRLEPYLSPLLRSKMKKSASR